MVDPIEFAETHADEVAILEELSHVFHEVEEGEIGPDEGLKEIKELLEAFKDEGEDLEEEGEGHREKGELPALLLAIGTQVEDGQMKAGDAIEAIVALTSEGEDDHAGHGHSIHDPHFWFDPLRVKTVVDEIAAHLS